MHTCRGWWAAGVLAARSASCCMSDTAQRTCGGLKTRDGRLHGRRSVVPEVYVSVRVRVLWPVVEA